MAASSAPTILAPSPLTYGPEFPFSLSSPPEPSTPSPHPHCHGCSHALAPPRPRHPIHSRPARARSRTGVHARRATQHRSPTLPHPSTTYVPLLATVPVCPHRQSCPPYPPRHASSHPARSWPAAPCLAAPLGVTTRPAPPVRGPRALAGRPCPAPPCTVRRAVLAPTRHAKVRGSSGLGTPRRSDGLLLHSTDAPSTAQ